MNYYKLYQDTNSEVVFLKVSIIDLLSIHQNNLYKLHNLDKSEQKLPLF